LCFEDILLLCHMVLYLWILILTFKSFGIEEE
jgi:hypothetical protein